jgi:hypothetical protein
MTTEWNGTPPGAHDPMTGVYHGDCRQYLSVLDAGSVPLVVADPFGGIFWRLPGEMIR